LRYRSLGRTGLRVSEIGFGAWGIGGDAGGAIAYGPADRGESLRALDAALDRGINFYDTSDFYGHGRSEELIGEAFAGRRGDVVIASKVGLLEDGSKTDFSAAHLRRALEASLKRLRTDYVDLYQLHSPSPEALDDEAVSALKLLKQEGKIRAYGLSARSPEEGKAALQRFGFPALQVNFNLIDGRALDCGLFELAAREDAGIVARTPLSFGFLTGRYEAGGNFHEKDHRRRWSPEQRTLWADAPDLFRKMMEKTPNQTAAQFALRFCLSHASVSSTIPGMLNAAQVEENAAAGDLPPLAADELRQVAEIRSRGNFFAGKR
jgi:aryl-alcohol dehydrogenase-like predicted oxidoreductase